MRKIKTINVIHADSIKKVDWMLGVILHAERFQIRDDMRVKR